MERIFHSYTQTFITLPRSTLSIKEELFFSLVQTYQTSPLLSCRVQFFCTRETRHSECVCRKAAHACTYPFSCQAPCCRCEASPTRSPGTPSSAAAPSVMLQPCSVPPGTQEVHEDKAEGVLHSFELELPLFVGPTLTGTLCLL